MSDIGKVAEALGNAMTALATGKGRIKERLLDACAAGLDQLDPEVFEDQHAQRQAEWLRAKLFRGRRPIHEVIAVLDENEAVQIAEIVDNLDVAASMQIQPPIEE